MKKKKIATVFVVRFPCYYGCAASPMEGVGEMGVRGGRLSLLATFQGRLRLRGF